MMATAPPPIELRKTTNRAATPASSGTRASLAIARLRTTSCWNRVSALAVTVISGGSKPSVAAVTAGLTISAGSLCASLASSIAAAAAGPAGAAASARSAWASEASACTDSASSVAGERQQDGFRRLDAERQRAAFRDNQPRRCRRAQGAEGREAVVVGPVDRQCDDRLLARRHDYGPAGPELGQAAFDADMVLVAQQTRSQEAETITHFKIIPIITRVNPGRIAVFRAAPFRPTSPLWQFMVPI